MVARRVLSRRVTLPRTGRSKDLGAATVELVVLFPLVLLITFIVVQGSLWFYARNVALGAAEEGARVAAADGSSVGKGISEARKFASEAGANDVLSSVEVGEGSGGADSVTITVTGDPLNLIPGVTLPKVSQSATAPLEEFVTP